MHARAARDQHPGCRCCTPPTPPPPRPRCSIDGPEGDPGLPATGSAAHAPVAWGGRRDLSAGCTPHLLAPLALLDDEESESEPEPLELEPLELEEPLDDDPLELELELEPSSFSDPVSSSSLLAAAQNLEACGRNEQAGWRQAPLPPRAPRPARAFRLPSVLHGPWWRCCPPGGRAGWLASRHSKGSGQPADRRRLPVI